MNLNAVTLRVLGSLMEKEMTTPETYPLSLNGIMAAANQKTSRDPVMELTEDQVRGAVDLLLAREWISANRDARVAKYEHRVRTVLSLRRDETAVMCLLILRGAQTVGELRGRAERMFAFDDLAAVQAALDRLAAREIPLAAMLPRAAGSREVRFMHLLGDGAPVVLADASGDRAEGEIASLRREVAALEARIRALEERA